MASDTMDKEIPQLKRRKILPRTAIINPFRLGAQGVAQNYAQQQQIQLVQQKQMIQEAAANRSAPHSFSTLQKLKASAPPPPPPPPRRSAPLAQQQQSSSFPESWSVSSETNIIEGEYEEVGSDLDYPSSITENKTIVSETPVAVSFLVHGESTIPSDGIEHQVSVAELPFSAHISYITIPRIDPRIFL